MRVIIDNGGSKADIAILDDDSQNLISQTGIDINDIASSLDTRILRQIENANAINFYSAGVTSFEIQTQVAEQLNKVNRNQASIEVQSDLLGAARSVALSSTGHVAILGTGSNLCYYDGNEIFLNKPALGYIIGDEGSGVNIGRAVLKAYLYRELSPESMDEITNLLDISKENVLQELKHSKSPAKELAKYASLPNKINHSDLNEIVYNELEKFITRKVIPSYENVAAPIHFVGSIAYFYGHLIKKLCSAKNLTLGSIIQKPIKGLIKYHNE